MYDFNKDTIEYFSSVIRYNISTYIDLYSIFVSNYQKNIENFYKFQDDEYDSDSFDFLKTMLDESNKIEDLIKINKNSLNRIDFWNLTEFLEEIKTSLETVNNAGKWLRSSKTKNNSNSSSIIFNSIIKQNETLEDIAEYQLDGYNQDRWIDISLDNSLLEKDYTINGGNDIQIRRKIDNQAIKLSLNSVVDNLIGEKLYGLDINKKINFKDDDLEVLSHKETIIQSVLILSKLKRKQIPEFPNIGVDEKITTGNNVGSLIYSSIIRQLKSVFLTDDTLTDFSVDDIFYDNTDLVVKYTVNTFFNKSITSEIRI